MMNINDLSQSKYLKKEDCGNGITVTISGLTHENLARDGEPAEMKYILQFKEAVKPLVLNMTNAKLIATVTGSPETDDWVGKQITLWNDPSVTFGNHQGGIRVLVTPQTMQPAQPAQFDPATGDDVPFNGVEA